MKRQLLAAAVAIALLAAPSTALSAQAEFVGDWKGLIAGQLTMVFHIVETDGELSATLDVPQQNAAGVPMSAVTVDGTSLVMTLDSVGGKYTGELMDDGSIEGQWTQTGAPQPQSLNLSRQAE